MSEKHDKVVDAIDGIESEKPVHGHWHDDEHSQDLILIRYQLLTITADQWSEVKGRLEKLDMLDKMHNDLTELHRSMAFHTGEKIGAIKKQMSNLQANNLKLKETVIEMAIKQCEIIDCSMDYQRLRVRIVRLG